MNRYVGSFGLLGFISVVVIGLVQDAELGEVLEKALLWGATFAVLGYALGWAARTLLEEAEVGAEFEADGSMDGDAQAVVREVDIMTQALVAREVEKSPILLEELEEIADLPEELEEGAELPDDSETTEETVE